MKNKSGKSTRHRYQEYGSDPISVRKTEHYQNEYVETFVDKWDELIDWDGRAESEGQFFIDILKKYGKHRVLDAATGTGFHSVQLLKAGFDVTSCDGSAEMLTKAFENGKKRERHSPDGPSGLALAQPRYPRQIRCRDLPR